MRLRTMIGIASLAFRLYRRYGRGKRVMSQGARRVTRQL